MNSQLKKMIEGERVPHLLLLIGPKSIVPDVRSFGEALLQKGHGKKELKNHPDLREYFPEGKTGMHSLSSMEELKKEIVFCGFESKRKVFILHEAERMLPASSNSLLKIFEEPPSNSVILLFSHDPQKILPTIRSRAQTLHLGRGEKVESELLERFNSLLQSKPTFKELSHFAKELEDKKKSREKVLRKEIPSDLTLQQKEHYEKEIEGKLTLEFQEELFAFFQGVIDKMMQEEKPLAIIEKCQKIILKLKLAAERSLPVEAILTALFLELELIKS